MKTGKAGIAIIKRNEGCRLAAYLDTVASPPVWTIGWGDTQNVHQGLVITQQEANDRLERRLANDFEPAVARVAAAAPTTQAQFDAMVSLAYNIGAEAFAGSSVARFHGYGQYLAAADAFQLWIHAGNVIVSGLVRRREEERSLYLSDLPVDELPPPIDSPPTPTPPPTPTLVTDAAVVVSRLLLVPPFTIPSELQEALMLLQRIIAAILQRCKPGEAKPDEPAPAAMNVAQLLDQLAAAHPDLDVRHSIIDLMRALGMPNVTLADRRELAKELGVTGDVGTAEVNAAMHEALLQKVADAGGKVPPELLK